MKDAAEADLHGAEAGEPYEQSQEQLRQAPTILGLSLDSDTDQSKAGVLGLVGHFSVRLPLVTVLKSRKTAPSPETTYSGCKATMGPTPGTQGAA